jgi:CheY-like chemotaxis protein
MANHGLHHEMKENPVLHPTAATRTRRALVAEDDDDMRRLVGMVLRRAGYEVVEASDGVGLLTEIGSTFWSLQGGSFDVIVSDINMPGLTGLEALGALPTTLWETPVILITAFGDEATHAEAHALGAFAVLNKPFAMSDLQNVLEAVPVR